MKELIEQKIKEKYGKKAAFSDQLGISFKDFASKMKTVLKKIDWLNEFLSPLGLEVRIEEKK